MTSFTALQVMEFKEERGDELSAASRTVDNVVEKIKNNIVWMKHNYKTIVAWLHETGYSNELSNGWDEEEVAAMK